MTKLTRNFIVLIVLAAIAIVAYTIGKSIGEKNNETKLINNYSFVRNIIELAGLEVTGTTTYNATNVAEDGGFWNGLQRFFVEKTATVTIPYTAKYGISIRETDLHIDTKDSLVIITMPATALLSFELHLDRLQTSNKKGLLVFDDDEFYNSMQKKLYADARKQLLGNTNYLKQSELRIEKILQGYYTPLGYTVQCVFGKN
ncbi:DUF4230 domain-containing protein [Phnomibacter sp. MR]|uniref:DUF4230 domain-containing protein n=1 Tax=Phnomibacter sp. MR TaxID=3042318 RepID=UPI003A809DA4